MGLLVTPPSNSATDYRLPTLRRYLEASWPGCQAVFTSILYRKFLSKIRTILLSIQNFSARRAGLNTQKCKLVLKTLEKAARNQIILKWKSYIGPPDGGEPHGWNNGSIFQSYDLINLMNLSWRGGVSPAWCHHFSVIVTTQYYIIWFII